MYLYKCLTFVCRVTSIQCVIFSNQGIHYILLFVNNICILNNN